MTSAFDWNLNFNFDDLDTEDFGIVGQSQITDASGNTEFQDTTLIFNDNFGTLDTTTDYALLAGTASVSGGILTTGVGATIRNDSFTINTTGKTRKYRAKFYTSYNTDDLFFGFISAGNYAVYFIKNAGSNTTWTGYIMDELGDEYETAGFSVSKSAYHEFEFRFNSERTDFYIDGVKKGSLIKNIPVNTALKVLITGACLTDYIRVWETILPK